MWVRPVVCHATLAKRPGSRVWPQRQLPVAYKGHEWNGSEAWEEKKYVNKSYCLNIVQ